MPRLSVGKVSIEGEMLDSVSGERMAAFVTGKGGRRWFSGLNAYKKWATSSRISHLGKEFSQAGPGERERVLRVDLGKVHDAHGVDRRNHMNLSFAKT